MASVLAWLATAAGVLGIVVLVVYFFGPRE